MTTPNDLPVPKLSKNNFPFHWSNLNQSKSNMNFLKGIFGTQPDEKPKFDQNVKLKHPTDGRNTSFSSNPQSPSQEGPQTHNSNGISSTGNTPNNLHSNPNDKNTPEEEDDMFQDMEVKGEEKKPENLYQPPKIEQKVEPKLKIESPEISIPTLDPMKK
jgi:hypothetical protein